MPKYEVNEKALLHARHLIDSRRYVIRSKWQEAQPSAKDQNAILKRRNRLGAPVPRRRAHHRPGQVFRVAVFHENHPDKDYKMANRVKVFDEPRAIAWKPGTESPETGKLSFGGWIWRYDLEANGLNQTTVTLTYDWSAVPAPIRERIGFPPFEPHHLDNSLRHLSDLVAAAA